MRLFILTLSICFIASCASPVKKADVFVEQDEWIKAVIEYRKASKEHPDDVEFRSRLKQTELKAADHYYQKGIRLLEAGNVDGAIVQYQTGLTAMPEHSKLISAMQQALARKEADALYREAISNQQAGRLIEAKRALQKTLDIDSTHEPASIALEKINKIHSDEKRSKLALNSRAPVTLNFRETDMKTAFDFIAKSFGVNVIFDEAVKQTPVTLFAKDVTFEQGLNLLLSTTQTFYKQVGPNTILIAPDAPNKRGQYEDHIIRTFHLNVLPAKEMATIIKGLITVKKIIVNEKLNALMVRDTQSIMEQVEKLISISDRKPAEMILDVEILEVNRTKTERLGLDIGEQVSLKFDPFTVSSSFRDAVRAGTVTLPSATFRFFKQDVDAKTLANPKVRVLNGEKAKIHIGDRVPLRSSTIQDTTGQVRTTFTYTDIGIRLNVEPTIHLDNSATVKLALEVSSLGENLGTDADPAFRVGTRNADSSMLLRDGETAILGGLIRDEERNSKVKIPGLGDIPIIGSLFTSYDTSDGRTDVLLTITPRIVRSWDLPDKFQQQFHSGTDKTFSSQPVFGYLSDSKTTSDVRPEIVLGHNSDTASTGSTSNRAAGQPGNVSAKLSSGAAPLFSFARPVYEANAGQDFRVELIGEDLKGLQNVPIEILYNPQLIEFISIDQGNASSGKFNADADKTNGVLKLQLEYTQESSSTGQASTGKFSHARCQIGYILSCVPYSRVKRRQR